MSNTHEPLLKSVIKKLMFEILLYKTDNSFFIEVYKKRKSYLMRGMYKKSRILYLQNSAFYCFIYFTESIIALNACG